MKEKSQTMTVSHLEPDAFTIQSSCHHWHVLHPLGLLHLCHWYLSSAAMPCLACLAWLARGASCDATTEWLKHSPIYLVPTGTGWLPKLMSTFTISPLAIPSCSQPPWTCPQSVPGRRKVWVSSPFREACGHNPRPTSSDLDVGLWHGLVDLFDLVLNLWNLRNRSEGATLLPKSLMMKRNIALWMKRKFNQ